jgi:hypothetical protein
LIDTTARAKTKDDTHRSISNNEDYSENDNDNDELNVSDEDMILRKVAK